MTRSPPMRADLLGPDVVEVEAGEEQRVVPVVGVLPVPRQVARSRGPGVLGFLPSVNYSKLKISEKCELSCNIKLHFFFQDLIFTTTAGPLHYCQNPSLPS